ncbi:GntT/GntP/DsdX family permease [Streptomyces pinistramenti]|uniref:GntT/GntP/DsdX family permease n=1 Tax=Streptomyces pinistramenti TaxID=2884812 RepID=UPI001D07EAA2|nr:gluconate:H+ symporter [Streptomyces pinistramenti]MCB5906532.1 GntP family permease [Streptomyces pinistramenti]
MTSDTGLLITAAAGIIAVIILITCPLKAHPFLALSLGSIAIGLVAEMKPEKLITSFGEGVGGVLGDVGIVMVLGTVLGTVLAESGGTHALAERLTRGRGIRSIPWLVSVLAFIVGLPLFFEVALAVLLPLLFSLARRVQETMLDEEGRDERGRKVSPYMLVGVPALGTVASLHSLVPPHPGPLAAAGAVGASVGDTLIHGLPLALVTIVVSGPLLAGPLARRVFPVPPQALVEQFTVHHGSRKPASVFLTVFSVLLPLLLMLAKAAEDLAGGSGTLHTWIEFTGEPVIALLIAIVFALGTLGYGRGHTGPQIKGFIDSSILAIAPILLIIGAGGGLKQILVDSGIGEAIARSTESFGFPPLLLAWFIAAAIRIAVGSATVAVITAAGIVAPIVHTTPQISPALVVLALGAGSIVFPHVNNAGSWYVKESFGMSLGQMFRSFTVIETTVSVLGLALVLTLGEVIP